jgi:prepilin-type processing-associated H-X9-DG protein
MGQEFGAPPRPQQSMPGWAWCIIIPSGCCLVGVPLLAAIMFPVFAQAREKARATSCYRNIRQQGLSLQMYAQDYDEIYPAANAWMDATAPYQGGETTLHCPTVSRAGSETYGYAYNQRLSRLQLAAIASPQTTPMNYDSSNLARNASDAVSSLPAPGRHSKSNNVGYADGHARRVSDSSKP